MLYATQVIQRKMIMYVGMSDACVYMHVCGYTCLWGDTQERKIQKGKALAVHNWVNGLWEFIVFLPLLYKLEITSSKVTKILSQSERKLVLQVNAWTSQEGPKGPGTLKDHEPQALFALIQERRGLLHLSVHKSHTKPRAVNPGVLSLDGSVLLGTFGHVW